MSKETNPEERHELARADLLEFYISCVIPCRWKPLAHN